MYYGQLPMTAPVYPIGQEPLPPGFTEDDRATLTQQKKYQDFFAAGAESCVAKTAIAGVGGVAIGAFFSMMNASFQYEDPLLRAQQNAGKGASQRARDVFKEMGVNMWKSGRGFGKVGALFAGIECAIEGYRARNDMVNPVAAGFLAGGILARNSGPRAAVGGGMAFAAFSAAIDLFLRRETPEED